MGLHVYVYIYIIYVHIQLCVLSGDRHMCCPSEGRAEECKLRALRPKEVGTLQSKWVMETFWNPRGYGNIRILHTMVSAATLSGGLLTRMQDPYVYVPIGTPNIAASGMPLFRGLPLPDLHQNANVCLTQNRNIPTFPVDR